MNTNDPKAPYGHQPLLSDEERVPLTNEERRFMGIPELKHILTDAMIGEMVPLTFRNLNPDESNLRMYGIRQGRDFYESLIQKGVLRVVRKVRKVRKVELVQGWDGALSCPCGYPHFEGRDENFCPKCGSGIQKPQ